MKRCKNCLLPAAVPGSDIDKSGLCRLCRAPSSSSDINERQHAQRQAWKADLERTLAAARGQGRPYDALVCLSGGKDSLYLLHRLRVDFGLSVLAFTTDVNIPDVAWRSIRRTVAKLEIDHLVYRPPEAFYRKLFRFLLTEQEARGAVYTVSYVYAPLFEGDALQVALEKGIPLVAAGYSPGQPEPERMVYEFSRRLIGEVDWTPPGLRESGQFSEPELARFWNPARYPAGTRFPRYIAPFHAWDYDQDQVMREVSRLGLVDKSSHASPVVSNYPINWLLMYSDLRNFGYNPYAPEFSALIRDGKASRAYWRVMAPLVDTMIRRRLFLGSNVTTHLRWLGLKPEELRITRPRGAYDPPI
ncbi:MAG: hypothetical protein HYZ20_03705 [Burkholderiales bacterium]|nr:hypothetical protein [Burkholderiales bacterium]